MWYLRRVVGRIRVSFGDGRGKPETPLRLPYRRCCQGPLCYLLRSYRELTGAVCIILLLVLGSGLLGMFPYLRSPLTLSCVVPRHDSSSCVKSSVARSSAPDVVDERRGLHWLRYHDNLPHPGGPLLHRCLSVGVNEGLYYHQGRRRRQVTGNFLQRTTFVTEDRRRGGRREWRNRPTRLRTQRVWFQIFYNYYYYWVKIIRGWYTVSRNMIPR